MKSRWRAFRRSRRGIADNAIGIALVVFAIILLAYLAPKLMARIRKGAREAGGMIGEFEAGKRESLSQLPADGSHPSGTAHNP